MLVSTMPFYFAMLEQYYTGELILQVVNGVDDGSLGYILLCFAAAYLGADYWKVEYEIYGQQLRLCHIIIYILFAILTVFTLD